MRREEELLHVCVRGCIGERVSERETESERARWAKGERERKRESTPKCEKETDRPLQVC